MAIGGKLGETGSDGTVGNSGAEPGVVVLVVVGCVCLYVCVCVSGVCLVCVGCAALLEHRGKAEEGGS